MQGMPHSKNGLLLILFVVCAVRALASVAETKPGRLTLWYKQPAARWEEALPTGNGRMGAMIFGGIAKERLQMNENTIWAGPPPTRMAKPGGLFRAAEARRTTHWRFGAAPSRGRALAARRNGGHLSADHPFGPHEQRPRVGEVCRAGTWPVRVRTSGGIIASDAGSMVVHGASKTAVYGA